MIAWAGEQGTLIVEDEVDVAFGDAGEEVKELLVARHARLVSSTKDQREPRSDAGTKKTSGPDGNHEVGDEEVRALHLMGDPYDNHPPSSIEEARGHGP